MPIQADRSIAALALAAALALLLAAPPLPAQEELPGVFGEVIDVRVVNIEVVVTDKGTRVTGLGPDDFILTVDGREVPIEYFTEVLGGTAVLPGAEIAGGTVPALAPGEDVGTSYLVFIDEYFSRPTDRDRLLRRMVGQLPNLQPGDRMAVVAYNGKKVEMLSSWSQSVEALERVFRKASERRTYGLHRDAEERQFEAGRDARDALPGELESGIDSDLGRITTGLDIDERYQAELITRQVERVVLAASSTLRSFASPPGRKVMLLLSGGWPYNPAYWVVNDPQEIIYLTSELRDGQELYRPLTETANRLSYTLYTVDVPGLDAVGIGAELATVEDAERRERLLRDRELDEHLTLRTLARDTGGRALIDGASLEAFQRVVEDTRSYYWLGFTPDWQGDDESHKVRVRLRRKGLDVRSRRGFSDLSRETEVTMMVESSLLFGNPPSAAPLGLVVGGPQKRGRGKVEVPLRIFIPTDELAFLPQGDGWAATTELRVAVLDEEGNASDIPVIPLEFTVPKEPEEGKFTFYDTQVRMRKKKHDMVVSVYDKATGKILSAKLELDPAALMEARAN